MLRVGEKVDLPYKAGENPFSRRRVGKDVQRSNGLRNNINPLSHSICIIVLNKIITQTLDSPALVSNQLSIRFF
jgi:hypothetical protein